MRFSRFLEIEKPLNSNEQLLQIYDWNFTASLSFCDWAWRVVEIVALLTVFKKWL